MSNLLKKEEIIQRALDKRRSVLRFLRDEKFTDTKIIAQLWCMVNLHAVRRSLKAFEAQELIISLDTGKKLIWGITAHGIMLSYDDDEVVPKNIYPFRKSKYNELTFPHKRSMQLLRIKLLRDGWSDWEMAKIQSGLKAPDAIATNTDGIRVAIEYERTIKTPKRYKDILEAHLESIATHRYKQVMYVSPSEAVKKRIERQYKNLIGCEVLVKGRTYIFKEAFLDRCFSFYDINELLNSIEFS